MMHNSQFKQTDPYDWFCAHKCSIRHTLKRERQSKCNAQQNHVLRTSQSACERRISRLALWSRLVILVLVCIVRPVVVHGYAVVSYGAQFDHVLFNHLTKRPLQTVADALIEQHAVRHEQQLLDGGFAPRRTPPPVKQLSAVG